MKTEVRLIKIRQKFNNEYLEHIDNEISKEFYRIELDKKIKPGMKIAITVGSRGIDRIFEIIQSIVKEIKRVKGEPFIIAAMGSHGGATAEGQLKILEHFRITEKSLGIPVTATMDTVELGNLDNGLPVYFNSIACHSDGIIVVNRIKVHTAFKGKVESGLLKMLSVGLGNHKGASLVHYLGEKGLRDYMVDFAQVILKKAPILGGFGILENAYDQIYKIRGALPEDFLEIDSSLLVEYKKILPKLPVNKIDLLIVQEIGKNISGTGMDTNIVGGVKGIDPIFEPDIKKILVLDLAKETQGNAIGIGIAHMITEKVYKKIDLKSTYTNTITTTFLDRARIPMIFPTESEAIQVGLDTIWNLPGTPPRVIIIKNTLKLDELFVSESIWDEIKDKENIIPVGDWEEMRFNASGELINRII